MGYYYYVDACEFSIDRENCDKMWRDAVKGDLSIPGVEKEEFINSKTAREFVAEILYINGFECYFDFRNNLESIVQTNEKFTLQGEFFDSIGSYVMPGSRILCHGEDGPIWRWRFNGVCVQEDADIVFQTGSDDCPIRENLGKKNACVECPFGLICLCDTNPRLRSVRCDKCGGEIIVDNVDDRIIAGLTCSCQKRTFLIRDYKQGKKDASKDVDKHKSTSNGGGST